MASHLRQMGACAIILCHLYSILFGLINKKQFRCYLLIVCAIKFLVKKIFVNSRCYRTVTFRQNPLLFAGRVNYNNFLTFVSDNDTILLSK